MTDTQIPVLLPAAPQTLSSSPTQPDSSSAKPARQRTGPTRWLLGSTGDPTWARPLLWLLLVGTAAFYLVDITTNGYANDFYAAAVKSGTESWKAWLFASLDSSNAITVDKPPAAMWIMGLSGRIFGFSSASMLIPEALMGVGTVALMYAAVKRWTGPAAGLVAGAIVALTPVAALMFRFNNPDALLVLLMTAAGYCVIRAIEAPAGGSRSGVGSVGSVDAPVLDPSSTGAPVGSTGRAQASVGARSGTSGSTAVTLARVRRRWTVRRPLTWLLLAGVAIGFAFLTKMLQGLLVLPGFALAYLWAAPSRLWTRIWHLLAAFGAVIVSAGWFVALVALWPAGSRPYIGGSTDNSLWELAIGYNGLSRIFGRSAGTAAGAATGGGAFTGGGGNMFGGSTGLTRMFGTTFGSQISWLIPAALIALVAGLAFTARAARTDRTRAALLLWGGWLVISALVFSFMQGTVHQYYTVALVPGIAGLVAIGGRELWRGRANTAARIVLAAMIAVTAVWSFDLMQRDAASWHPWLRWVTLVGGLAGAALLAASVVRLQRWAAVGLVIGSVTSLAGMTGWSIQTVATSHSGATPLAGPASAAGGRGAGRFGAGGFGGGGFGDRRFGGGTDGAGFPAGGFPGGELPGGVVPGGVGTAGGTGGTTASAAMVALLEGTTTRWAAATIGAMSADGDILSTDKAVMAIGGFTGSDPSPTLAQFQAYVKSGQISYFIAGGGGFGGRGGDGSEISSWVEQNYKSTTVGGTTVYDLRTPTAAS